MQSATRGRPADPKARKAADCESRVELAKTPVCDTPPPSMGGGGAIATREHKPDWGTVRVHRFEVGKIIVGDSEAVSDVFKRWHEARQEVLRACNVYLQAWQNWHYGHGSLGQLEKLFAEFREWESADPKTRGAKPHWTVSAMPPKGDSTLYDALTNRFPALTKDTLSTLMQVWKGNLTSGKDSKGRMKRWIAILLGLENLACVRSDAIIPIKAGAYELIEADGGGYQVSVRTTREDIPGKDRGRNFVDQFWLRLPKRGGSSQRILERCLSGEYLARTVDLQWHPGKRRWFFLLAYQQPKQTVVAGDPKRVAILRPAVDHPWELKLPEKTIWLGGDGRHVSSQRQRIFGQRESRQRHYRYAGSANKGHGRRRALQPIRRLERAWKDFVRTANHRTTREAVDIAMEHRCGKIIYEQPIDTHRDECFLGSAGKQGIRTQSFWDWHQVASLLLYKAQESGVHAMVTKVGPEDEEEAA